jgi:hypothetical protein
MPLGDVGGNALVRPFIDERERIARARQKDASLYKV